MRQIIAMGGGGFSIEPDNPILDKYILEQTGKARPRICFFPHATDDAARYTRNFFDAFTKLNARPTYLSLFSPSTSDLKSVIMAQDVIYVGGGNTKSMLALWREWGLDDMLIEAYEEGIILAGLSAGAMCWFEQGLTDSYPKSYRRLDCLGILSGSCCPHYNSEPGRQSVYRNLIATNKMLPGIALDDGAAAHYRDGKLWRVTTSKVDANAYHVMVSNGEAVENKLKAVQM